MLEKTPISATDVKVTFRVPPMDGVVELYLCGEFNNWHTAGAPLVQEPDGSWMVSLVLTAGKSYRFRYLDNQGRWHNDWDADAFVPNDFGTEDSVVDLVASLKKISQPGVRTDARQDSRRGGRAGERGANADARGAGGKRSRSGSRGQKANGAGGQGSSSRRGGGETPGADRGQGPGRGPGPDRGQGPGSDRGRGPNRGPGSGSGRRPGSGGGPGSNRGPGSGGGPGSGRGPGSNRSNPSNKGPRRRGPQGR